MKHIFSALLAVFLLVTPALASAPGRSQVVLQATEEDGFVCADVSLGSYAADTIRHAAGTDFSLLPSNLLGLNLQPGAITGEALAQSFPRNEPIYVISHTPALLREYLEVSASTLTLDKEESLDREASDWGGFLQVSGLKVIYDVPAPVGDRVYEVTLNDGTELDLTDSKTVFTAAVPACLLDGTCGYPSLTPEREVGLLRDLVAERIAEEGVTEAPDTRRIILYGARQNEIVDYFPPGLIVLVVLIFVFFGGHKWRRALNFER